MSPDPLHTRFSTGGAKTLLNGKIFNLTNCGEELGNDLFVSLQHVDIKPTETQHIMLINDTFY